MYISALLLFAATVVVLSALKRFIDALSVEQLGPCLSQIANALSSSFTSAKGDDTQQVQRRVATLLERLLCDPAQAALLDYYAELPVLPAHPLLTRVNETLAATAGLVTLPERLGLAIQAMVHESWAVRAAALTQLKRCKHHHYPVIALAVVIVVVQCWRAAMRRCKCASCTSRVTLRRW